MADEPTRDELKSEVFTLKMKCHQYEERMKLVNLHGLDGETLHMRNQELEEQLAETDAKLQTSTEEVEYFQVLLGKTRTAIEKLNKIVLDYGADLQEKTKDLDAARARCQELEETQKQSEADKVAAQERCDLLEAEVSRLAPMEATAQRLPGVLSERNQLAQRVQELEEELASTQLLVQQAREEADKAVTRAELANIDLQTAQKDFQRETARRSEELEQKHAQAQRRFESIIKENELQMNLYEERVNAQEFEINKYATRSDEAKQRERDLNEENSRLKVELKNARRSEEINLDRLRRELEDKRQQDADAAHENLLSVQSDLTSQLHEKRRDLERACKEMSVQKEKHRRAMAEQGKKLEDVQAELDRIKVKWKNSMSNKRITQKENVRTGNVTSAPHAATGVTRKPSSSKKPKAKASASSFKSQATLTLNGNTTAPARKSRLSTAAAGSVPSKPFR
ncbi:Myosin-H heavy chain [Hondaea fermentalgiana]|uniref:Myosin-H heavy chain n=1 Tax=Hondaea fermentalgiana TaxID=2315210 RepID=A0A2R5GHG5_9STRA|nr:Myosin-H heavy chain [Hondaea fermentalgiana]|eukprot:GBG27731.1 Myosin-H heavy chain [Hondaea fermentalgiana]